MTKKRFNNSQAQRTPSLATAAVHSLSPTVKTPTASIQPSEVAKPKTHMARVKAWAWRFTAGYFWLHSVLTIIAGRDLLLGTETVITTRAVALLSSLGFAPVNVGHLPLVFLAIWLLAITTFSPVQLLVGLPLYIIVFPVTVLGAWFYRKTMKAATSPNASASAPQPARHFPLASFSVAMLVGWFVLYSISSSRGPH